MRDEFKTSVLRLVCTLTVVLAWSGTSAPETSAAEPRAVTIPDSLGVDWSHELVHESFALAPGELTGRAQAEVATADGQALTSQVTDVERHADGSIRAMKVWFFADAPAHGEANYTITPGEAGRDDAGVSVKRGDGVVELLANAPQPVGIRLPLGGEANIWPTDAADVPGPIQALRLRSGAWTGRGAWNVPFGVKSWRSDVVAEGPLFAEVKLDYLFDTGFWTFRAKVVQGEPLVVVSEEFDNGWNEQPADQVDRFYTFDLTGKDFQPTQAFVAGRAPKEETDLFHCEPHPVVEAWFRQPRDKGSAASGETLRFAEPRVLYGLVGWPTWSNRVGVAARIHESGGDAIGLIALDTPYWRNQMAVRLATEPGGHVKLNLPLQVYEQSWPTDGYGRTSPNATGRTTLVPDTTARRKYAIMLTPAVDEAEHRMTSLFAVAGKLGSWPLDEVRRWTLDWPDPMANADWAEETSDAATELFNRMQGWVAMKRATGAFGINSMHDYYHITHWNNAALAEIINDTSQLTAADRGRLRKLAAHQAYIVHSVDSFPWGTGAHLGNPNMSMMAMQARAFTSETIPDHPMIDQWGRFTLAFLESYVQRYTRESGAPYECPHYTLGVTLRDLVNSNRVLMDAGIGDALDTDRFRAGTRFVFNWLLPKDQRFNGYRTILPLGNTSYQSVPPEDSVAIIEYLREGYPKLAGQYQWFANQTFPDDKKLSIVKDTPVQLGSGHYADYGVFMRHGFGTPYETYFQMMAGNTLGHYETTDHMCYTLYAQGQPINLHFGNGYFPQFGRPWLRNRVAIDHRVDWGYERNYADIKAATFTEPVEYAHAALDIDELLPAWDEYPPPYGKGRGHAPFEPRESIPLITWHRQVMFLKDQAPAGPNYFVIRDTFAGRPTKPSEVNYWMLSADMQRNGNTFHFAGQLPVNMDLFVNTPANPTFETDKFSHVQQPYGRFTGFDPKWHPDGKRAETQQVLRLKQPPTGDYMVALYPRLKDRDPPAKFTRLGESVLQVETPLSTDIVVMNHFPVTHHGNRVQIEAKAAAVRFFKDGRVAVVNNEDDLQVTVAGKTIVGSGPFVVTITGAKVAIKKHTDDAVVEIQ